MSQQIKTKEDLLKQINQAASQIESASQFGDKSNNKSKYEGHKSTRNQEQQRTAHLVLQLANNKKLTKNDIQQFITNEGKFDHTKTLWYANKLKSKDDQEQENDLRSLKSEYDYGKQKKFVDILSNREQKKTNGLEGLEDIRSHIGNKNLESTSIKSKYSNISRRNNLNIENTELQTDQVIDKQENDINKKPLIFVDRSGKIIELNCDQILLLEKIQHIDDISQLTNYEKEMLQKINFDDLKNLDPEEVNQVIENSQYDILKQKRQYQRTNKKMFEINQHSNSEEYKDLGFLHKDKRRVDYYPQDQKQEFSSKPQIKGRPLEQDSQISTPISVQEKGSSILKESGKILTQQQKDRAEQDFINRQIYFEKMAVTTPSQTGSSKSQFPKTTNQDFHNEEVFINAFYSGQQFDRKNYKRSNPYSNFVNAMFNQGVFVNPSMDQC